MKTSTYLNPIRKLIFFLILTAAATLTSHAQSWTSHYNGSDNGYDGAAAIAVDTSGNVLVTGGSVVSGGGSDFLTIKYSNAGAPLWTNRYTRYSGPAGGSSAQVVATDASGNVFVAGSSGDGVFGEYDAVTIKFSSAGLPLWTNLYIGTSNRNDEARVVAVDHNGDVIVAGAANVWDEYSDYLTMKYSSAGVLLWTRLYNGPGNRWDGLYGMAVDSNGNVFVTGGSSPDSSNLSADIATLKYSSAGALLWTRRYSRGGSGNYAYALAVDNSGNVLVTGTSFGVGGLASDYVTIKYSNAGLPLWTNLYHGPGTGYDRAYLIAAGGNGNVFVAGQSKGSDGTFDYATIAYSSAGVPLWTNRYHGSGNGDDRASAIVVGANGNVYVTGGSVGSDGKSDFATITYSNSGLPLWTNRFDGTGHGDDSGNAIAVDGGGNVFVTGSSWNGTNSDCVTIKYAATGPPLNFSRTGPNTLTISWPSSSSVSNLQQTTALVVGAWTAPPEPIANNGTTKSISVDTSGGTRFFRLSD